MPAPEKTGHALFAAALLLAGSCQSRLFYKLPRRRSIHGGALSYPFHLHLRQTTAFISPLSRATAQALHPMPGCSDRATRMQTGKGRPLGPAFLLSKRSHHIIIHQTSPPAYSPTRFLIAWTESAPVGFCMFFPRVFSSKIGVRRNCNRIVIIFLSNLSPIWLRKSLRKRINDASSSIRLFIHRK